MVQFKPYYDRIENDVMLYFYVVNKAKYILYTVPSHNRPSIPPRDNM